MTEKREDLIDEIVVYLATANGYCIGKAEFFAEDIADYILAKEEEVRKKTAKALIDLLKLEKQISHNVVIDYQDKIDNVIKFIKKMFGLKVYEK